MKVQISEFEKWPCYGVIDETKDTFGGTTAYVNKRTYERWKRTITKFEKVQKELQTILNKADILSKRSVKSIYDQPRGESCACYEEYEEHTCPYKYELNDDNESLC